MKKIIALSIMVIMCLGLFTACSPKDNGGKPDTGGENTSSGSNSDNDSNNSNDADKETDVANAVELLNKIWASYKEDEKFPATSGNPDDIGNGAPGEFKYETGEELNNMFAFPADKADKIDSVASLVHMMNLNTFSAAAYHLKNTSDAEAVAKAIEESVLNHRWMCGFPEKLVVVTYGDYVVSAYGASDLIEIFKTNTTATFSTAKVVVDVALDS